ncbi:helicase-associated domain-containing protein [Effusibacillus dendaii]|uniref:Helicase XPB/Ssl2 N-terminal domain-containing protein n=1 Tax=Effusibacillus dendaii TaxID=2743772 RepID=A0A7I8D5J0_9BACL|nr:helicase-associated domain-containing protein [Effusibacillus dendaii]BCJ85408.1 hypothetical protein skT53_03930 [Effusibacillus dendaii]
MRLSECLNLSDIDALRKIAETYEFDCHRSSKNSLMQAIMTHFYNRTFIEEHVVDICSEEYRETLLQITMDRRQSFSKEELHALVKRAIANKTEKDAACDQQLINQLLREGWLYRLSNRGGHNAYVVPEDVLKKLQEFITRQLQTQLEFADSPPVVYRYDEFAIIRDMAQFLSFVKKQDIKLTQDGVIFKRQLQTLLDTFEMKEELQGKGWRFGYGRRFHDYPDRFALFYDYCYSRGLIEEHPEGNLLLTDAAEDWLNRTNKDKLVDLFKFWRLLYRRPIPRLPFVVTALARAVQSNWTFVRSVNRLLAPYVSEYYYDSQEQVMEKRIYQMMVNLGLLCYGKTADGRDVVKLSELGSELLLMENMAEESDGSAYEQETALVIHPNFDILLPTVEAGRMVWELNQFSELIRADLMRVYRITKQSVGHAFKNGWTAETIIQFLNRHSGDLVPSNVKRMIQFWSEEYQRHSN